MRPTPVRNTLRSRTPKAPSLQSRLPLFLICALCIYGMWFLNAARSASAAALDDPLHDPTPIAQAASPPLEEAVLPLQPEAPHVATTAAGGASAAASNDCSAGPPADAAAGDFSGRQWLSLTPTVGVRLDTGEVTLAAWVRPLPVGAEVASMQTVLASKASGCDVDAAHNGVSLFVNAWGTDSQQLFLSWGNGASGCEELATTEAVVPPGKWTHVAGTINAAGDASLYVNGVLRATTARGATGRSAGKLRTIGGRSPISRGEGPSNPMRVGQHPDAHHGFNGHLASVAVFGSALSAAQLAEVVCDQFKGLSLPPLALLTLDKPSANGKRPLAGGFKQHSAASGSLALAAPEAVSEVPRAAKASQLSAVRSGGGAGGLGHGAAAGGGRALGVGTGIGGLYGAGAADSGPGIAQSSSGIVRRHGSGGSGAKPAAGWPIPWIEPLLPPVRDAAFRARENASDVLAYERREHVRGVMKRAWGSYRKYAFGADEIKPISNRSHDWLRLGATLVDCLDNLWIMGLKAEFAEAREWVATKLHFRAGGISMFETVIRILGGLLSAFELSADRIFLTKSVELADKMMYAFEKNANGLPCTTISLSSKDCRFASWTGSAAVLAEFGTIQLEFKYLSHHTGDPKYWRAADKIMRLMQKANKPHDLFPVFMNPRTGVWSSGKITFGALGDSAYEYLIKQWLQTNKKEPYLREMFDLTMKGMAKLLVHKTSPSGFAYIADWNGASVAHKMDHLACFAGAMLAVGAQDGGQYDAEYMGLADRIGETCFEMYARTKTGLAPEFVQFQPGRDMVTARSACYNIGRPEAVETFFVMWYYTRDPKWREMGWKVFEAFERHAATYSGWAAIKDVDNPSKPRDDKMESFVLAETVKYLYLLFDPDYPIPLEKYVINTEAHPLGRFDPVE